MALGLGLGLVLGLPDVSLWAAATVPPESETQPLEQPWQAAGLPARLEPRLAISVMTAELVASADLHAVAASAGGTAQVRGSGTVNNRSSGKPASDQPAPAVAKSRPWRIQLPASTSLTSYATLLDTLGMEIIVATDASELVAIGKLTQRRPSVRRIKAADSRGLQLVGDAGLRTLNEKLIARAQIATEGARIWLACPPRLANTIHELVHAAPASAATVMLAPLVTKGRYALEVVDAP